VIMPEKICNVFISHIHEDDAKLQDLKALLAQHGCNVRDSSVTNDKPNEAKDREYIKHGVLAPRIGWAGALIVLVSPGTRESWWVDWEIEYARQHGKRIIGVWDYGAADSDVPENLDKYHDALLGWRGERIVDAVFGRLNERETPTGELPPERVIPHYRCDGH